MGTTGSVQTFDSVTQTVSSNPHYIADTPTGVRDTHVAKRDQTVWATVRNVLSGCFANTNGENLPTVEAEPVQLIYVEPYAKGNDDKQEMMQVDYSATSAQDPHMYASQNTRTASPKVNLRKRPFPGRKRNATPQPKINGFVLEKSLQNGYSGKVFRGYEEATGAPVVVKCCRKLSSWQTETKALSELQHENIIGLVGTPRPNVPDTSSTAANSHGSSKNSQFIHGRSSLSRTSMVGQENTSANGTNTGPQVHVLAQEYASNGDLYELLQSHGPVDEPTARALMVPIVTALQHAYTTGDGISHRDIKLENIFVAEDGTIKVGDWGLAAFKTRNRQCTSSCGTLGYMAPEMVCRESYDSNKTDVWALAVVLFSLATGVRPYAEPQSRRKDHYDTNWRDEWLSAMIDGRWKLWWSSHAKTTAAVYHMSSDLRDLLQQMFCGQSDLRASLADVLDHPWMQRQDGAREVTKLDIAQLCRGY